MNTRDANSANFETPSGMLFDLGDAVATPSNAEPPVAQPRLRLPERQQGEYRLVHLDRWLPPDHQARLVWHYVCGLDLSPLLARIQAVEGKPGRDTTDPRILLALWLYATLDGVGSAREVDRLCVSHLAYMWICGGVSLNYHTIADFRVENGDFLENLLIHGVAALRAEGLVDLQRVAQDGMRVRASAGASSFRRRVRLKECLQEAKSQVERLRQELDEDPAACTKRQQAAQQRAAQERLQRVQRALEEVSKIEQRAEARQKGSGEKARASTTDPEARRMKMPDGGTRPGYNAQFATDTESRIIVGVDVTNIGNDSGQMGPMVDQIKQNHDKAPAEYLVDGGFATKQDIDYVSTEHKVTVYAPIKDEEKKRTSGQDPFAPRKGDSEALAQWRARMGTDFARALYVLRSATAEWTNAQARNRGLYQVRVRGLEKVKAVLLWHALAHNLMQAESLRTAARAAAAEAQAARVQEAVNQP